MSQNIPRPIHILNLSPVASGINQILTEKTYAGKINKIQANQQYILQLFHEHTKNILQEAYTYELGANMGHL